MPLNRRNKRFCELYTDLSNRETYGNASESARQAGYSPRKVNVTSCQLLTKVNIKNEIAKLDAEQRRKYALTKEEYQALVQKEFSSAKTEGGKARFLEILGKTHGFLKENDQNGKSLALFQLINNEVVSQVAENKEVA